MARIKLVIYNDLGEEIGTRETFVENGIDSLDTIESEVESFRKLMLPEITKIFLEDCQATFKKNSDGYG